MSQSQNSAQLEEVSAGAETITPDQVMDLLGIKRQAYYDRIKFLGIKAAKSNKGKAYLSQDQFVLMQSLDSHIKNTGAMDGFILGAVDAVATVQVGELAIAGDSEMATNPTVGTTNSAPESGSSSSELEQIMRMAAELKTSQLVATPEIVKAIAAQMSEEDLPSDLQTIVKNSRESAIPKFQPVQVATQMLDQWRSRQNGNQQTATV